MPQRIHPTTQNTVILTPPKERFFNLRWVSLKIHGFFLQNKNPGKAQTTEFTKLWHCHRLSNFATTSLWVRESEPFISNYRANRIEWFFSNNKIHWFMWVEIDNWWFSFFCGIFCQSYTCKVTNSKIHRLTILDGSWQSDFVWRFYICLSFACLGALLYCIYGIVDDGYVEWIISACVFGTIFCIFYVFRAISTYKLRRHFLKIQLEKGHYPNINDEEKCASCRISSFCTPCMYGQINVAQM